MAKLTEGKFENGTLTIELIGKIDSANASQVDEEIAALRAQYPAGKIVLDAEKLEYTSSAGLRVLLKWRKAEQELTMINVSKDVYEVLEMTGFTQILNAKKALRKFSAEGLEVIGKGATGTVYRLDPDTILKVFIPQMQYAMIDVEREIAQKAFLAGVPTAISYDVVRCGDSYGVIYELLNSDTLLQCMMNEPENEDAYIERYAAFMRELHQIELPETFMELGPRMLGAIGALEGRLCTTEETNKLRQLYASIPARNTFVHGDFHPGNIMMQNGELILIDMSAVGRGHPIQDLITICGWMKVPAELFGPEAVKALTGLTQEKAREYWAKILKAYFQTDDEEYLKKIERRCMGAACLRSFLAVLAAPGHFTPEQAGKLKAMALEVASEELAPIDF